MKKQSGSDLHQPSQEIPVYISETATPVKLKYWKQLYRISGETGGNKSITVNLLISSHGNGPYAAPNNTCWQVIGPTDMKNNKNNFFQQVDCHRS